MTRRMVSLAVAALAALVVWAAGPHEADSTSAQGCPGRVAVIDLPASRYPAITDHIRDSWAMGYPRVLRVHRAGAKQRRDRLLDWYEARHPQPKGDHLDLDEAPAASLRASWRADVRPIDERENRSAGAKLGNELRGLSEGACVRYNMKG